MNKKTGFQELPTAFENDTIRQVVEIIDRYKVGIALIVDTEGVLVGTVTDGDIRRYILRAGDMESPAKNIVNRSAVRLPADVSRSKIRDSLAKHKVRQIPLVDLRGRPIALADISDFVRSSEKRESLTAVIMAGGEGRRLRPLTENLPKPMLEVGGRPLLERLIEKLKAAQIEKISISVNYQADKIENYFGDGSAFGVEITYLREEEVMGTAGSLRLLSERPTSPFFVMNGDIITELNFQNLYSFHSEHRGALTVCTTEYHIQVPFGVLEVSGAFLNSISEKPSQRFLCSAGIYVLDPEVLDQIPDQGPFDMPVLIEKTMGRGLPVTVFPIREHWIDVGQHADLDQARRFFVNDKSKENSSELTRG